MHNQYKWRFVLGEMTARHDGNNTKSRYRVEFDEVLGHVVITPRYADAMTLPEAVWLRSIIAVSLKAESINAGRENSKSDEDRNQDVDAIVRFLTNQHRERRIPLRQMSSAMGLRSSTLTSFNSGNVRSYLDVARPWAFLLGFDLVPIPVGIRDEIWRRVYEYCDQNAINIVFGEVLTLTTAQHTALIRKARDGETLNQALNRILGVTPEDED